MNRETGKREQQAQKGTALPDSNHVLVQAAVLAAASMIVRIIGLLYRSPLTAIIGDEGNGYYGTAYNIYTIILMVSSYSVPSAVSKLMAQKLAVGEYQNAQRVFHCALIYGLTVGIAASALLFFGAELFVPSVAAGVLRVFAPTVFFFGILAAMRGYFQAQGSMVQTSVSQILEQLANAVVSITAAYLLMRMVADQNHTTQAQYGAAGSALGTGSGVVIALLYVTWCYARSHRRITARLLSDTSGRLDSFGTVFRETVLVITPFMLSGFIMNLTTSLNQTIFMKIMINMKGMEDTAVTTIYGIFSNKAVVITNIPISIATAVASAIIPGISAAYAKKDLDETRRRAQRAKRITMMIAIPSAIGLIIMARPIMMLLFPQKESLEQASVLLALTAVTVIFYSTSTITNALLQAIGKMNMPLLSAGFALVIQTAVLCVLLMTTRIGIYALVIVSILYSVLIFIMNERFLKKYLNIEQNWKRSFWQPLFCSVVMGFAAWIVYGFLQKVLSLTGIGEYFVNFCATVPALLLAVILYTYLLIRCGAMSRTDVLHLPKGEKIYRLFVRMHWMK